MPLTHLLFLDSLAFNSFIPLILQPTRITSHSNTLINNIFSNVIDPDMVSGKEFGIILRTHGKELNPLFF